MYRNEPAHDDVPILAFGKASVVAGGSEGIKHFLKKHTMFGREMSTKAHPTRLGLYCRYS